MDTKPKRIQSIGIYNPFTAGYFEIEFKRRKEEHANSEADIHAVLKMLADRAYRVNGLNINKKKVL